MTPAEKIVRSKMSLLELADFLKNISKVLHCNPTRITNLLVVLNSKLFQLHYIIPPCLFRLFLFLPIVRNPCEFIGYNLTFYPRGYWSTY